MGSPTPRAGSLPSPAPGPPPSACCRAGAGVGWGFQLQSPVTVALLAYLLLAMGLSLSGVFHLGASLQGLGQGLARRAGLGGSFLTGALAAGVATPCTAPFMGTAVGFA